MHISSYTAITPEEAFKLLYEGDKTIQYYTVFRAEWIDADENSPFSARMLHGIHFRKRVERKRRVQEIGALITSPTDAARIAIVEAAKWLAQHGNNALADELKDEFLNPR
jgi:hypothetical protein